MSSSDIKRYQVNLRDELDGAALYTQIAAAETDAVRKDLFLQLAQAEATHAQLWRAKLAAAGIKEEPYVPSFRTQLLGRLARHFGPGFVMPTIAAAEFADRDKYASQADAHSISAEERGHAAVVQELARASASGTVTGAALDTLAREELGIDPTELGGNAFSAAATSFALFSVGAIFPILPFIWLRDTAAIATSLAVSAAALGGIGLLTSLFNGRNPWYSAARQAVFGCGAAAVTYGIGSLLGVSLS